MLTFIPKLITHLDGFIMGKPEQVPTLTRNCLCQGADVEPQQYLYPLLHCPGRMRRHPGINRFVQVPPCK